MIDNLLEIGATFDWISPLASVVGDLVHGGGYTFLIPTCPIAPREMELMLGRKGVKTWGLMHVDNTTMISVRKADAQKAYGILKGAGVPVENPPKMAKSARPAKRSGGVFAVFDEVFRK